MDQQIPKIIHYCWFGGNPLPELANRCIESWKQYCPDYEIRRWDESNFDLNCNRYVQEAYAAKKWAFVSDVARLNALVSQGGIYLDTDVELLRPFDAELLRQPAFCGLETSDSIATAVIGCQKGNKLFLDMLNGYQKDCFLNCDGTLNTTTNVMRLTRLCKERGFVEADRIQKLNDLTIFPIAYFCPKDLNTGVIEITPNTYAIHHYDASWWDKEQKYARNALKYLQKFLPIKQAKQAAKAIAIIRYRGILQLIKEGRRYYIQNNK